MSAPPSILVAGDGPAARRLTQRLRDHGHPDVRTVPDDGSGTPGPPSAGVTWIDRARRLVRAHVGGRETVHSYDTLVLVPRARPRLPDLPGLVDRAGCLTDGVVALDGAAPAPVHVPGAAAVLGDGPSAVETASALAARGVDTTLVCSSPQPLSAYLGAACGALLAEELRRARVSVRPAAVAVRRTPGLLHLADGTAVGADTLLLCAGTVPDTRLARAAGLRVRHGIVVDERLRTSDPRIHAIGDCAEAGGRVRPGPGAAWDQAETLAAILGGHATAYRPGPSALRPRIHGADVAAFGTLADLDRPGSRLIGLTDPAGRRYARLALRGDHVVAAVLLGLPEAIATIGLCHRHGRPLPSDRLGLLLNLEPRRTPDRGSDDDSPVCLCNNVSRRALRDAWRAGARTAAALAGTTRATTGCGGCGPAVAHLCGVWASGLRDGELEAAS
ncbi:FAD-dependent oxidoreductase [Streptomyces sp. ISL-12]|uniref:NAD(P)/FAD-dependent oxidoreductase n=1 Tax=Streptomyces sp. ISL-12 TaxID=2819177 RepID=UPI001BE99CC1|nr:FAD-dependent oxidoreductase [Streptomyces sp. ISL-12]MBT2410983.1 FAD-dependent oxidoreductase [Streptomyces sp. ISL-12]